MRSSMVKVLIVDDEPFSCRMMEAVLQKVIDIGDFRVNFSIKATTSSVEAMKYVRDEHPQVVFTDLIMPQTDGFRIIKEVRNLHSSRETIIVVVSALGDREARKKALEMGANDYALKPIDSLEFFTRVRNVIELAEYYQLLKKYNLTKIIESVEETWEE